MNTIPDYPTQEGLTYQNSNRSNIRSVSNLMIISNTKASGLRNTVGLKNIARRTLGIALLLATVVLWTSSNFLASYIFADDSYSKPYFVTYVNTAFFAISLIPIFLRSVYKLGIVHTKVLVVECWQNWRHGYKSVELDSLEHNGEAESLMLASNINTFSDDQPISPLDVFEEPHSSEERIGLIETAKLSLEFCLLWFSANYLIAACLEYTSVASSTILSSTSSIWTLIFGILAQVERFSFQKLSGVLASLAGIILISTVDLSDQNNDENRGNFPHKSKSEIAIGDAMAFGSAIMYGIYTVVMKKRIGNEDRVNMPLFFGLVGLFNVLFLWPGFIILHLTGIETFELPPTKHIWTIVLLNSTFSFVSDFCWAYAMLLTTPLVVTVGLSMSIPLSLVGQIILSSQHSSGLYWAGAFIVLLSFLLVNHESKRETDT